MFYITSSVTISIDVLGLVFDYLDEHILDFELFNKIAKEAFSSNEIKKIKILRNILDSDREINYTTFAKSFGETICNLLGLFQLYFNKIDLNETREKLLCWMETNNENENEYLESARCVKKLNNLIEVFDKRTKEGLIVYKVDLLEMNMDNILKIKIVFSNNYGK